MSNTKKPVTLQDLANSSKAVTTGDAEEIKKTETTATTETMKSKGSGKMREVSLSDIRSTLPEKEISEEDKEKMPEILNNAFEDMVKTMEGKKERFDREIRPQIEAAKREAEIEAELAEAEANDAAGPVEEEEDELDALLKEVDNDVEDTADDVDLDIEPEPEKVVKFEKESAPEKKEVKEEEERVVVEGVLQEMGVENKNKRIYEVKDSEPAPKADTVVKTTVKAVSDDTELSNEIDSLDVLLGDLEQDMKSDDDDIETDGEEDVESVEELRDRLKKQTSKLKSSTGAVDRSNYSISKKTLNTSSLLNRLKNSKVKKTADWPLLATGRNHTFIEADGPELEALQKTIQNSNSINGVIASLRFVYNHIEDANKPGFERWCKLTKYEDLESLYFGVYKACYGDVNLIGRTCAKDEDDKNDDHCGKTSVIDTPINDMYKFEDDEAEAKFKKLYEQDTTTHNTTIESKIFEVSDQLAIGYSDPTIYTTLIQFSSLSQNILNKHEAMLNTLAYIDDLYFIDDKTKQYIRLDYKVYPDNLNKTIMSKLKAYVEFCKCITSDQYDAMVAKISQASESEPKISYILPKTVCPECGATIPEEPAGSMLELLFTHRQLTAIANS